ncbi:hypothetical protein H9L39_11900 [Fusarium oxysporum f. sp. albedinis]|nr:hypothetical protein H9L39_11900 [Fusarium oxysporum f. sp. albedinis]
MGNSLDTTVRDCVIRSSSLGCGTPLRIGNTTGLPDICLPVVTVVIQHQYQHQHRLVPYWIWILAHPTALPILGLFAPGGSGSVRIATQAVQAIRRY